MKVILVPAGVAALCGCAHQPPPPHIPVITNVKPDPAHPSLVGEQYYPAASRRLGEEGVCRVALTVLADGHVDNISLASSSGFPRLDDACLRAFKDGFFIPATVDGKPIDKEIQIPITWKLVSPASSPN